MRLFGVMNEKRASGKLSFHAFTAVTASWTAVLRMLVGRLTSSAGSFERRIWVARLTNAPHMCRKHVTRHGFLECDFWTMMFYLLTLDLNKLAATEFIN